MKTVDKVRCIRVEKREIWDKQQVYILAVTWSDKKTYEIGRTYSAFFDFRAVLAEAIRNKPDINLPALHVPGTRWFERGVLEKKKRAIEEFCQKIIQMPKAVTKHEAVISFFERWHVDHEADSGKGKSGSKDKGHKHNDLVSDSMDPSPEGGDQSLDQAVLPEEQYVAVGDFEGKNPGEVNLHSGCCVEVMQKDLSGWWFVLVEETQQEGWAPSTLLCPADPNRLQEEEDPTDGHESFGKFRAIAKCEGHGEDEVSYKKGDTVEVLNPRLDGWWKVCVKGKTGFTPATNLEPMKDSKEVSAASRALLNGKLYHHHSIYKKLQPPPRRQSTEPLAELYAKVVKRPRQRANKPSLQYTEISFDDEPDGPQRPIIIESESGRGVTYAEILVSPLVAAETEDKSKAKRAVPKPPLLKSQSAEEVEDEMYENIRERRPSSCSTSSIPPCAVRTQSYENVGSGSQKLYRVTKDCTPSPRTKGFLHLRKGDVVMSIHGPQPSGNGSTPSELFCVLCAKTKTLVKGWVPVDCLFETNLSVIDQSKHPIPSLDESPEPGPRDGGPVTAPPRLGHRPVPTPRAQKPAPAEPQPAQDLPPKRPEANHRTTGANGKPAKELLQLDPTPKEQHCSSPVLPHKPIMERQTTTHSDGKKREDLNHGPWFVGMMNRCDCEALLLKQAKPREFVIRASTNRVGDFTLSVMYENRVRHFPIELRGEGKYNIGKHDFKNLTKVVKYYQTKPIFYDDENQSVCLGQPLPQRG